MLESALTVSGLPGGTFASAAARSGCMTMACSGTSGGGSGMPWGFGQVSGGVPGGVACQQSVRPGPGAEGKERVMRRYLLAAAVTAAAATLAGLAPADGAPAGAAAPGPQAAPGARLWAARYNDPANRQDYASSMAVGPGGRSVFVTGTSYGGRAAGDDYLTVAYSAVTGRRLWASRYSGAGITAGRSDFATSVAVSPGGSRVFVTGGTHGRGGGADYGTVAYSAATGRQLWASRYNGPANGYDAASGVAVSPDGKTVFVTGHSDGRRPAASDYATVAYAAVTGRRLWIQRYNSPYNGNDFAMSVAVSPDGTAVYVTGQSNGGPPAGASDYATVAYDAATGSQLWASRYNGPGKGYDAASGVAVSPDGTRVFVTGESYGRHATGSDYATVAYDAATGNLLWVGRYNGPGRWTDEAWSVAVSPRGSTVFVTGDSIGGRAGRNDDYATVAYRAATGRQLWARRYDGPSNGYDAASSVAVSPDGTRVYVTGESGGRAGREAADDYATVAYRAATGRQLWVSRYNGPGKGYDAACRAAVSPDGSTVFVTGSSFGGVTSIDYTTIGYRG